MASNREGTWPGGYVRRDAQGRKIYIIRRSVAGTRFEVSTGCTTLRAAMAELERWEANPGGYKPGAGLQDAIYLDAQLVAKYLDYCARNTDKWLRNKRALLGWWGDELRRVDLRRATLRDHILPALDGTPQRNGKIATIKHLYAYLREKDLIETAEDPCFGKLRADPPVVAQHAKSKVITQEQYEQARSHMVGIYRDALDLLAGTGWHITEAKRFAEGGEIEPYRGDDPDGAVVLTVRHKSGALHRTVVTEPVADAAARLRAHGRLSESMLFKALRSACAAAKIEPFTPGRFRHTIATMAYSGGHAPNASAFLGHKSSTTTKKHYAVWAVPPRVPTMR